MRLLWGWIFIPALFAQECEFAGSWILDPGRSEVRQLPFPEEPAIRVTCNRSTLTIQSVHGSRSYAIDGQPSTQTVGSHKFSSRTKWEGSALLLNSLSTTGRQFTLADRWRAARDGNSLTIRRQYLYGATELESTLHYRRENAPAASESAVDQGAASRPTAIGGPVRSRVTAPAAPDASAATPARPIPQTFTVPEGTRVLVRSVTAISTKSVSQGSRVYLEVATPVAVGDMVVIPRGSQVTATVTSAARAGRARGKAELNLRFDSIILPGGAVRAIQSRVASADGRPLDRQEGTIRGGSDRAADAGKVGAATSAGASAGSMAGNTGIGAAAGAAAGLAGVFASRGPDILLEPGATLEFALDRPLTYDSGEIR